MLALWISINRSTLVTLFGVTFFFSQAVPNKFPLALAVDVEPPVAHEHILIEDSSVRAEHRLAMPVFRADVENLKLSEPKYSRIFEIKFS